MPCWYNMSFMALPASPDSIFPANHNLRHATWQLKTSRTVLRCGLSPPTNPTNIISNHNESHVFYVYVFVQVCIYIYIHIWLYMYIITYNKCICIYIYIYIHTFTFLCIHIFPAYLHHILYHLLAIDVHLISRLISFPGIRSDVKNKQLTETWPAEIWFFSSISLYYMCNQCNTCVLLYVLITSYYICICVIIV